MIANAPSRSDIAAYYDARIDGRLKDFVEANPRIEAAIETLSTWAPAAPRRVLEIGCGIGASAWRMARAWPNAEVIGTDLSAASIDVARTCFKRSNLSYETGAAQEQLIRGTFDLVLLMDVYEHIPRADRPALHATLRDLLSDESRLIITVPGVLLQQHDRVRNPAGLQPVDESVTLADVMRLAEETRTRLLYYREIGVWEYGDYLHLVVGRHVELAPVAIRQHGWRRGSPARELVRRLLGPTGPPVHGRRAYFGPDLLDSVAPDAARRFAVSADERARQAARWWRRDAGSSS